MRLRVTPIALLVLGGLAGLAWLLFGAHRRAPERWLAAAVSRGLVVDGGSRPVGVFSTVWRGTRLSLRGAPGVTAELGDVRFRHWPLASLRVTVSGARLHLRGEPVPLLQALVAARGPLAELASSGFDATYEHRVLGRIDLEGIMLDAVGSEIRLRARQVRAKGQVWPDVRLAVTRHRERFVIAFGEAVAGARLELSFFPSQDGASRWLLDVLHQPARPLIARLGRDPGPDFEGARVAGALSLDVPDDPGEAPGGRAQLVLDRWPLGGRGAPGALVGPTASLLSSFAPAADGVGWQLPRVEVTMPVLSLAGPGRVRLWPDPDFFLEADGERSCTALRALLPPSPEREQVERFFGARPEPARRSAREASPMIRVALRLRAGLSSGYRLEWTYQPACGLPPWKEDEERPK